MTPPAKRPTSTDVARVAGVSRTTVSFVLNDRPGQSIPEETRRRVIEAARHLDYRPHASARALVAGRSDIVLLAVPGLPLGAGITRFVEELDAALAEHGMTLVTHLTGECGRSLADVCASVNASAVVGFGSFDKETARELRRSGAAIVFPTGADDSPATRTVGRMQVEHLVARGHRRLGYALPGHPHLLPMGIERLRGAEEACDAVGIEPPVSLETTLDSDRAAGVVARCPRSLSRECAPSTTRPRSPSWRVCASTRSRLPRTWRSSVWMTHPHCPFDGAGADHGAVQPARGGPPQSRRRRGTGRPGRRSCVLLRQPPRRRTSHYLNSGPASTE